MHAETDNNLYSFSDKSYKSNIPQSPDDAIVTNFLRKTGSYGL